ncbi:MAG TPA: ATP-binding protein [Gemmatirosa sp.]
MIPSDDVPDAAQRDPLEAATAPLIVAAFRTSPDALVVLRAQDGHVVTANHAWVAAVGRALPDLVGTSWVVDDLWASQAEYVQVDAALRALRDAPAGPPTTSAVSVTWQVARPSGVRAPRRMRVTGERLLVDGASYLVVRGRAVGPPDDAAPEAQESQRLEELGRLAAGVAHDFNNLLTVVQAYAQLIDADADAGRPAQAEDVAEIRRAVARAADLTRRLLTFSREQVIERRAVDLNAALRASVGLLRPLLGAVVLELDLGDELPPVFADPTQLDQLVLNLAVNARDAMPAGGRLTLRTRLLAVSPEDASALIAPHASPGEYAMLEVADTGRGMDAGTAARAFDPFFTTKGPGRGTGLGLAVVYGIVRQSAGVVRLASTPGVGTTVTVLWPCIATALAAGVVAGPVGADAVGPRVLGTPQARRPVAGGHPAAEARRGDRPSAAANDRRRPRVLVVEDEGAVRAALTRMLTEAGYVVTEAAHGADALAQIGLVAAGDVSEDHVSEDHMSVGSATKSGPPFDVVLSDVAMPTMSGRELAARLLRHVPTLPVVLMSGYSSTGDVRAGLPNVQGPILGKPFERPDVLARLAAALRGDAGAPPDAAGPA